MVQVCGLGNGGAFHFYAKALEILYNLGFVLAVADKLVAADNPSLVYSMGSVNFLAAGYGQSLQMGICWEGQAACLGNLAKLHAYYAGVHVMVEGVRGDYDVANIDFVFQGACYASIDDMGHCEQVT